MYMYLSHYHTCFFLFPYYRSCKANCFVNIIQEESDWLASLLTEVEEMKLEFENSRNLTESLSSVVDELLKFSSQIPDLIYVSSSFHPFHTQPKYLILVHPTGR